MLITLPSAFTTISCSHDGVTAHHRRLHSISVVDTLPSNITNTVEPDGIRPPKVQEQKMEISQGLGSTLP